jgi:putative ABC transport system substrate-binding protein
MDVIYTRGGTASALAAARATRSIPIIFDSSSDPVALGLVASLSHPGGNLTGLSGQSFDTFPKGLQYLQEATGSLTSFAWLTSSETRSAPWFPRWMAVSATAASALGIRVQAVDVDSRTQLEPVLERLTRSGVNGVAALAIRLSEEERSVAASFIRHRLPSLGSARNGFLVEFGIPDGFTARTAARYVDRILKGAKPAELPVEQPSILRLSVNVDTARALGLKLPRSLLLRADKIVP